MKLYIAGSWHSRARLRETADRISGYGYEVTSRWLTSTEETGSWTDLKQAGGIAMQDLEDIRRADGIIVDTLDPSTSGGRDVEWGYAIARMLRLRAIVGPVYNGFHIYGVQFHFPTWEEAFTWLRR